METGELGVWERRESRDTLAVTGLPWGVGIRQWWISERLRGRGEGKESLRGEREMTDCKSEEEEEGERLGRMQFNLNPETSFLLFFIYFFIRAKTASFYNKNINIYNISVGSAVWTRTELAHVGFSHFLPPADQFSIGFGWFLTLATDLRQRGLVRPVLVHP